MIDWNAVSVLVRRDRRELRASQTAYGRVCGLSQGQISEIEGGKMSRPTAEVLEALRRRLGNLPELGDGAAPRPPIPDRDLTRLAEHAYKELGDLLPRLDGSRRAKLLRHLTDQITYLARAERNELSSPPAAAVLPPAATQQPGGADVKRRRGAG